MAKGKIYESTFKTLKDDTVRVEIWKEGATAGTGTLTLAGEEPVVIEYDQETVFEAVKKSTCTVKVVTDEPLMELYTGTLSDIEVRVYMQGSAEIGESLVWYGFLGPNVYTMPYDSKNNELGLEFVCPLTAMESVGFRRFETEKDTEKFFATFEEYITRALEKVGAGDIVTTISGLPASMSDVGCAQRNYIDETNDEEDGSMQWDEVMESIMRYMNKTCVCIGGTFLIYDPLEEPAELGTLTVAGQGNISLGEVYNKVTVVANNNPMDSSISNPLNDDDLTAEETTPQYHKVTYYPSTEATIEGCPLVNEDRDDLYVLLNAAFTNKKWELTAMKLETYEVEVNGNDAYARNLLSTTDITKVPWDDMMTWKFYNPEKTSEVVMASLEKGHIRGAFLQKYASTEFKKASSLSWSTCLTLGGYSSAKLKTDYSPMIVAEGGYLILSLKFMFNYFAYPQSCIKSYTIPAKKLPLLCYLKIGDRYWNGEEWTTEESNFSAYYTCENDEYNTGTEVSIDNEVGWEMNMKTDKEGMLIPLPENTATQWVDMSGKIEFSIENCEPEEDHTYPQYFHITELALTYVTSSKIENIFDINDSDTDIKYTGNIGEDNVEEAEDVDFTTNSWTDKATSHSYAMRRREDGSFRYVLVYYPDIIPEKMFIKRFVSHYKQPKLEYNVEVENSAIEPTKTVSMLGKTMTTGTVIYDLQNNTAEVTLLEI